jgi:hypothetical protein
MRMILALTTMIGFVAASRADVASGPKEGEKVAALKVYAVTGEPKDKDVDYTELRCQFRPPDVPLHQGAR